MADVKDFDPKKLVADVDIDKVVPNGWNPKEEDTKEFEKIVQSVKLNGLRGAIVVREHPHTPGIYEIIDGQQRWGAAKQNGYKKVSVYNEGKVGDQEAKQMTIWYQQQVPFQRITEAYLVDSLIQEFGLDAIELPYTDKEIQDLQDLAVFNFDQFKEEEFQDDGDGTTPWTVKLSQYQFEVVTKGIKKYGSDNEMSDAEALTELLINYVPNTGADNGN